MKVALLQLKLSDDLTSNIQNARNNIIRTCEAGKPDFILLPGFFLKNPAAAADEQVLAYGKEAVKDISGLARKYGVHIIAGSMLEKDGDQWYVSSSLIGPDGSILGKVQKIYDDQRLHHAAEFPVFPTEFGKVAVILDNDLWTIEIPRILALKGAELIFAPGVTLNWSKDQATDNIWGISVFNCVAIAYCSSVQEGALFGGSIITTPLKILSRANNDRECVVNEVITDQEILKLRQPDTTTKNTLWYVLKGRKPDLYGGIVNGFN